MGGHIGCGGCGGGVWRGETGYFLKGLVELRQDFP